MMDNYHRILRGLERLRQSDPHLAAAFNQANETMHRVLQLPSDILPYSSWGTKIQNLRQESESVLEFIADALERKYGPNL